MEPKYTATKTDDGSGYWLVYDPTTDTYNYVAIDEEQDTEEHAIEIYIAGQNVVFDD